MKEKVILERIHGWPGLSGYFKPKGHMAKRRIHKLIRKMHDIPIRQRGIYNRIGIEMEIDQS
jgi:hypothetical protein